MIRTSKKIAAATLAGVAILGAGCSSGDEATPSTPAAIASSTSVAPPALNMPVSEEDEALGGFMYAIESEGLRMDPDMAPRMGDFVCRMLADDIHPFSIAAAISRNMPQYSEMDGALIVGASIGAYCPKYSSILEEDR